MTGLSPCGEMVRKGDPVRFRTALFAPPDAREGLFALYAFNLEIAKIAPMVSEPMIGEIRLQWWRDSLDMAFGAGDVRRHEVVEPLAAIVRSAGLPRAPFDALIDARGQDLDPAFPADDASLIAYLRDTAGSLTCLAMRALGGEADEAALDAGQGIGIARYLAAVPVMAAQGAAPLPGTIDWKALRDGGTDRVFAAQVSDLVGQARAAIASARKARTGLSKQAAPAFLEVPIADRFLTGIRRDPGAMAALSDTGASPFRANLSNLYRGITGRW